MGQLAYQWRRLRAFLWNAPEPVTRTIIAVNALTFFVYFVAAFLARAGDPWAWLTFSTWEVLRKPWSLVTYPLVTYDPLTLILAGYWLWIVGGTLERSWSSRTFLQFFAGIALVTSLGLWIGSLLISLTASVPIVTLSSLWMPLAALTVAWCLLNPDQIVLLGFVLPIRGRLLMWIVIALTYFLFAMGTGAPWLGFFALAGVGTAYLYTRRKARWVFSRESRRRAPGALVRALDWIVYYWERWRRGPWRR